MKIKSPCTKKCKTKNGICVGCERTLDEIARWSRSSDSEKIAIIDRITIMKAGRA
jgi:predicted Fe-S protein YdhL (DUF1289 family)